MGNPLAARHATAPGRPRSRARAALDVLVMTLALAATAGPAVAGASRPASAAADAASSPARPCTDAHLPDRGPLRAERERIAAVDADLKARNEALALRGGTLDVRDLAAVEAYDRDVAALRAEAAANDRAWEAYEAALARTNQAARDAVRCGRVRVGGRTPATPDAAAPAAPPASR